LNGVLGRLRAFLDQGVVLWRFGMVGVSATLLYFVIASLLNMTGAMEPVAVNATAAAISIAVSYIGHHRFTYGLSGEHLSYLSRYFGVTVSLYLASCGLAHALNHGLRMAPFQITAVITVLYPAASFALHHLWTFSSRAGRDATRPACRREDAAARDSDPRAAPPGWRSRNARARGASRWHPSPGASPEIRAAPPSPRPDPRCRRARRRARCGRRRWPR
jgi:putative flippase GtrA